MLTRAGPRKDLCRLAESYSIRFLGGLTRAFAASVTTVSLVGVAVYVDALTVAAATATMLRVVPPYRALGARADTRVHRDASDATDTHEVPLSVM